MSLVDSLAEQRTAIATAVSVLGYPVYHAPVDDPIPPAVIVTDPAISPAGAGSLMQAIWTVRLLFVRADPRSTSQQSDANLVLAIQVLTKIPNFVFLGAEPQNVTEVGFMLPTYSIQGSMALSVCS